MTMGKPRYIVTLESGHPRYPFHLNMAGRRRFPTRLTIYFDVREGRIVLTASNSKDAIREVYLLPLL